MPGFRFGWTKRPGQAANWAARAALWLLEGKLWDDNHCLVVNEALPEARGVLARLGVHWERWAPIPKCEACGSMQGPR